MRITHPFHPLRGEAFEFVARRVTWGEARVWVHDAEGRLRSFPAGWTDLDAPDPFDVRAAGRCPFRVADLLRLATLVRQLSERDSVK